MGRRGFTLLELFTVFAVVSALAVMIYITITIALKRANNAAIYSAARTIALDQVAPLIEKYQNDEHWGGRNNKKFLNGQLNLNLSDRGLSNVYGYKNPVSNSEEVLVRGGVPGASRGPAVFVTRQQRYRYDKLQPNRAERELKGSVVVVTSNNWPEIEVYYIDVDGNRSEFLWQA